jgi:hypothetical protein
MPDWKSGPLTTGYHSDLPGWSSAQYAIRIVLILTPSGPAKLFKIIPNDFVIQNPHEPTNIHETRSP